MTETTAEKLPGKWSLLGMRLKVDLVTAGLGLLLYLLWFLVVAVRWLCAPLVLLLQGLFMVPYARTVSIPVARSGFERIAEAEVPDEAWIYFRETASRLGLLGYRAGPCVRLSGLNGNQTTYGVPLTDALKRIGMGVNYSVMFNKAGQVIDDRRFVELTAECGQGHMLDFTNNEETEPFIPSSRTRVRLPHFSELELLHLFSAYTAKTGCTLSDTMLARLQNEPDTVLWDEFRGGMEAVAQEGYLVPSPDDEAMRMTWKGAFTAGLLAQWPCSVLVDWKRGRAIDRLLSQAGMSRDTAVMADIAAFLEPLPWTDKACDTLESLCCIVDPLVKGFSDQVRLSSAVFYYPGLATSNTPVNILCTYVLHEVNHARALERNTELLLDIDVSSGAINWLTVDDGHYAQGEFEQDEESAQPLSAPVASLLPLQRVLAITEPLVAGYIGELVCQGDELRVIEAAAGTLWQRTVHCMNGDVIEVDLDGRSGEVLRSEMQ